MSNRAQNFVDELNALLKKYNCELMVVDNSHDWDSCTPELELDLNWQEGEGGYWDTITLPNYLDGSPVSVNQKFFKKS